MAERRHAPCPFHDGAMALDTVPADRGGLWQVECRCGARGPAAHTRGLAWEAWDGRPAREPEPAQGRLL